MEKQLLQKYFEYKEGNLFCKITHSKVGHLKNGYLNTRFFGKNVFVHRLIWILHYGSIKESMFVDHINRNTQDNNIKNLRLVDAVGNSQNTKTNIRNTSGQKGVCWKVLNKKWQAYINIRGSYHYLGLYKNFGDAVSARLSAEKKFGYLTNEVCQN